MKYARIYEGVVDEFFATDGDMATMFHPSLIWVPIDGVSPKPDIGWLYNGSTFSAPPVTP